jgi:hypothetical protein
MYDVITYLHVVVHHSFCSDEQTASLTLHSDKKEDVRRKREEFYEGRRKKEDVRRL